MKFYYNMAYKLAERLTNREERQKMEKVRQVPLSCLMITYDDDAQLVSILLLNRPWIRRKICNASVRRRHSESKWSRCSIVANLRSASASISRPLRYALRPPPPPPLPCCRRRRWSVVKVTTHTQPNVAHENPVILVDAASAQKVRRPFATGDWPGVLRSIPQARRGNHARRPVGRGREARRRVAGRCHHTGDAAGDRGGGFELYEPRDPPRLP